MPIAARRPCKQRGCKELVAGSSYCAGHTPKAAPRESAHKRGYGHRWRKARAGWLREHPLCVECERAGKVVPATDLDHIVPHRGDMGLFWDAGNWQSLCHECHSAKTAREDGGFGNRAGRREDADG